PPLPLIQMREDRPELRRQHLLRNLDRTHNTPECRIPGNYGLFSGTPLSPVDLLSVSLHRSWSP
ncbi:MAG TPA: hypothetical protein VGS19_25765, partial [Streptosporangiaceae bacterium]|nr:hypothetical protein [Streptosporangiaceae bacterium]